MDAWRTPRSIRKVSRDYKKCLPTTSSRGQLNTLRWQHPLLSDAFIIFCSEQKINKFSDYSFLALVTFHDKLNNKNKKLRL